MYGPMVALSFLSLPDSRKALVVVKSTLDVQRILCHKKRLTVLEDAQSKDDLSLLPSNHFEALMGDRKGQFSIRINQQWRLCFEWAESENRAFNIEVADYH